MKLTFITYKTNIIRLFLTGCFVVFAVLPLCLHAQTVVEPSDPTPDFRIERVPVAGGAEIVTIFANRSNFRSQSDAASSEIPLVSILRDTLGDERPENDRLRYVWMLTYTRPSFWQKAAAFLPFLYIRTTNKNVTNGQSPPPIADMNGTHNGMWNRVLWMVFKRILNDEIGFGTKASAIQFRQNATDYKRSSIAEAQAILSLYESVEGEKVWSDAELKDIQAKLWLTKKTFGGMMQSENLGRFYDKQHETTRDIRGHNWELLRQYSEAQGLYFEPLEMPDGSATHGIVWAASEEIAANQGHKFDSRFLNIRNPWTDPKLANWKGYSQVRWFDDNNRPVEPNTTNTRSRTMIPLALYGLDFPKIPTILVDFRDNGNAKRREISKRILNDLLSNVLSISKFSSVPYFLGRVGYDFATGRRGMDVNQDSRLRSYAQLKMLLALDDGLNKDFRNEIAHRLEKVSVNPLQNDLEAEVEIARTQYKNLIEYAKRPDGLPARLERDRSEEMVRLAHSGKQRTMFSLGHALTLGLYTHREKPTPELVAQMDTRRQLEFHERVLQEIAYKSANPDVDSDIAALKRALMFISENGSAAKEKTTRSLAKIFAITKDENTRTLCLAGLYRIDNSSAKKELLAIYHNPQVDGRWRNLGAQYLKQALGEGQRMSSRDAVAIAGIGAN